MEKPLTSTEEAIQQMAIFQHQCDQMMFWINYKVLDIHKNPKNKK